MAKGQPNKKKAKKDVFTVYFNYDGIFTSFPLKYSQGQMKELNDTNFDEMLYEHLKEIALRLIPHACFEKIYYCQTGAKLSLGVKDLKSTQDIVDMLKVGYDNANEIDMCVEHFRYDIMEFAELKRNEEQNHNSIESSDDEYYGSDDCEEIENVDFQTEGESVVIKNISTHDPFLNKLCSARIMFRGTTEHHETETPLVDPNKNQIDAVNKVQSDVHYPAFDPDIPWDKMEPTLGMRYETPHQLKLALANYGVAYGYQLWYMKNDWREVLVYYGRNVEDGRCAGKKGNKDRVMKNKVRSGVQKGVKKKVVKKKVFFKEIIEDPFMSLRKMRDDIRQKFMIDVSLGQCRRAKQLALFDHEGGLIEHYGKLYQYMQALLDSNPGSTCRLDVDESANGSATFIRIYICFKGVKDGWLAGCRKGLIDAVNDWLPEAGHRKCTRHIYANFKKKYSGLQYQILFWAATSCTLEQQFMQIMDQIKQIDECAYDYLIQINLNSWSRAFFEMDRRCAAFENGISESFNRAILGPRQKHIITMLEEIRLYIMQRLVAMNKLAFNLEDRITPSVRKRLEILKEKQRMWELSGVPCVHVVAAYLHCGIDFDLGVSHWTNDVPPLPPLVRRLLGRPQKARIKAPCKSSGSHTSRGRGRCGIGNEASGSGMGGIGEAIGGGRGGSGGRGRRGRGMASSDGRRGGERGSRGVGSTRGGGMAGSSSMGILTSEELDEMAFRECMEEQAREQARIDVEQERFDKERREEREWEEKQYYFNPANFREDSIEEAPFNQAYAEVFILSIHSQPTQQSGVWVKDTTDVKTKNIDEAPASETTDVSAMVEDLSAPAVDKGKGKESVEDQASAPKKKRGRPPSHVDGIRIYHKNRRRSERIANIKEKKAFQFDKHGIGRTPDKAFDVDD
ncbi:hypothetical protein Tco_1247244 [Tanacetum coccineum]